MLIYVVMPVKKDRKDNYLKDIFVGHVILFCSCLRLLGV